jgi:hypothetical protein
MRSPGPGVVNSWTGLLIAVAVALRQGHFIVVGRPRLQAGHTDAENRLAMPPSKLRPSMHGCFPCL